MLFRNSELISSILGRSVTSENYITFNLEEDSIFRSLRIMTFRKCIGEYDLDNMPAEYMINLFRAISKYPQYDYLVDEILAIIISELGETV